MRSINCGLGALLFLAITPLPFSASAAAPGFTDLIVRIKASPDNLRPPSAGLSELQKLAPNLIPAVPPSSSQTTESLQALQRHRLDRYFVIDTRHLTRQQAQALRLRVRQIPGVETAEFEPMIGDMRGDNGTPIKARAADDIPDYTGRQNYLQGRGAVAPYMIGGVNAIEARGAEGGDGQGMRVISAEIDHWSFEHVDLPPPYTQLHSPTQPARVGAHDTASAGIIASRENSFGTTGIVPHAQLGYLQWGAVRLGEMAQRLQAGDVMQLGVHYLYGDNDFPADVCTKDCYMPLEDDDLVRDTIAYLTEEKGVHVVLAAANGNINLDHPYFDGRYDRNLFDSGSIYAGAVDPGTGLRSTFSEYGSRVDLFSWGGNVTTTTWSRANPTKGYTHTFSGTSSANPIIAGVVASLQGVARANGLGNLPPKALRALLVSTGYPQINGNHTEIGVQPDLDAAIKKMLGDGNDRPPTGRLALPEYATSGQTFSARVYAESPAQKPLMYRWEAPDFIPPAASTASLYFLAPNVTEDTPASITVKVSDGTHTLELTEPITITPAEASGSPSTADGQR
jgi:Subtilisin-like serine proteases